MRITTLCYMENAGCYLMMHRTKKQQDENAGMWIGIGGHLEENESPLECIKREIREETGIEPEHLLFRGIITFLLPAWGNELTFLYTADTQCTHLPECNEGVLRWIRKEEVLSLPLWEGDKVFLNLLKETKAPFDCLLSYNMDGELISARVDGKTLPPPLEKN